MFVLWPYLPRLILSMTQYILWCGNLLRGYFLLASHSPGWDFLITAFQPETLSVQSSFLLPLLSHISAQNCGLEALPAFSCTVSQDLWHSQPPQLLNNLSFSFFCLHCFYIALSWFGSLNNLFEVCLFFNFDLMYVLNAINVHIIIALIVQCVPQILVSCVLIFILIHGLFIIVLFSFQVFGDYHIICYWFLLWFSCLENTFYVFGSFTFVQVCFMV